MKVIPTTIAHQPADPRIKTGDENSTPNRGGILRPTPNLKQNSAQFIESRARSARTSRTFENNGRISHRATDEESGQVLTCGGGATDGPGERVTARRGFRSREVADFGARLDLFRSRQDPFSAPGGRLQSDGKLNFIPPNSVRFFPIVISPINRRSGSLLSRGPTSWTLATNNIYVPVANS